MSKRLKIIVILFFTASVLFLSQRYAYASAATSRLAGDDRYKTAVAISQKGWPNGSQYAVLVTSEDFPDALSAAPLAKKYNAPILLTGKDTVNTDTSAELKRLKVKQIYIIGGTGVISQNVETTLKSMISGLKLTRIAGSDRYETAVDVAQVVGVANGAIIATGEDFADALSAAPIAAKRGMPIILVPRNEVAPSVQKFINGSKINNLYIIDSGLSDSVSSFFNTAVKITGDSIYDRNINIINTFSQDLDFDKIYVATGDNYPDALGAAALAAASSSPVILTDNNIPQATRNFVMSNVISNIVVVGGSGAVSVAVDAMIKELPAYIYSTNAISLSVLDGEKYDLPNTVTANVYSRLDGYKSKEVPVTWNLILINDSSASYAGTVKGYPGSAQLTVNIRAVPASQTISMTAQAVQYGYYVLPPTVPVKFTDGTYQDMPVTWSPNTVSLNKVGALKLKGTIEGFSQGASLTINVVEDKAVTISDAAFRSIIYYNLGDPGQTKPLYLSDLLSLRSLKSSSSCTINSLQGIENMVNLEKLELDNAAISNLKGLQSLTNLRNLTLVNDGITDISSLKTLTNLQYLSLVLNHVTDISALKGMTRLRYLYLAGNTDPASGGSLSDFSPVRAYYDMLIGKDFTYDS